jgi:hypothetical protein
MANLGGAVFVSFNCLHYKGVNMKTTIDMAREVKATAYTNRHYPDRTTYTFGPEQLKAFEALVRADERALAAPVQEPDYAWSTVDDYEKDVGFQVGEAFKMAWNMARTTNGFLNLLSGEAPPPAAQRTWVELSSEDKKIIRNNVGYDQFMTAGEYAHLVQEATEIKLKELNT